MTLQEKIAVMQAAQRGETIQARNHPNYPIGFCREWTDRGPNQLQFNFSSYEYRVRPTPREFWINRYDGYMSSAHASRNKADAAAGQGRDECIHVREVL